MIENQKIRPAQVIGPLGEPLPGVVVDRRLRGVGRIREQRHVVAGGDGPRIAPSGCGDLDGCAVDLKVYAVEPSASPVIDASGPIGSFTSALSP